jgi:hypothetical protein
MHLQEDFGDLEDDRDLEDGRCTQNAT